MLKKDNEIKTAQGLAEILDECKVLRIAMVDDGIPYIVPMNFGYEFLENKLVLFFHCAKKGRKIDVLIKSPHVCFEMDCFHELIAGGAPCDYSYGYASIIGEGRAVFISDYQEKIHGLNVLMKHQTGRGDFTYKDARLAGVVVFKVVSESYTGKTSK